MLNKFAPRDYVQRLDQSICRYQGFPVFVRVESENRFNLYKMDNQHDVWKQISPTDEAFDVASLPLGYCQSNDDVVYLTRRPLRRFKQGIDEKCMTYSRLPDIEGKKTLSSREIVWSKSFINMIIERYPSLDSALETLNKCEKPMSLAISRNVALHVMKHKVINVYYKNDLVGWIAPGDKTVHVPNDPMGWIVSTHLRGFNWIID